MGKHPQGLKQYLRSVGKALPYPIPMKRHILSQFSETVEDYLVQNPQADIHAIQTHFGTPQEIAMNCVDGQDTLFLMGNISAKRKFLSLMAGVMAAIILFGAGFVVFGTYVSWLGNDHYIVEHTQ